MGWGGWGVPPHMCTCMYMHTHTHTCMHGKHDNFMQMATPLGESLGIPYDIIGTYAHVHPRISQNSKALELIEIFQFCLKI